MDLPPSAPERKTFLCRALPRLLLLLIFHASLFARDFAAAGSVQLPDQAPIPQPRGDVLPKAAKERQEQAPLSSAEKACRKELRTLGVEFTDASNVTADGGCSLPHPIEVTKLSKRMRLEPPALLECSTALAAARFFQSEGKALARKHFEADIETVQQASGYVCRPIGDGKDLSQHAFGKALDVSGLVFSDKQEIKVGQYGDGGKPAAFLKALRAAACGPFSTVLGPGTNADHEDHFHFDTKKRRKAYCR